MHPEDTPDIVGVGIGDDSWLVWDSETSPAWIVTDAVVELETAR